jgi:AcrR family transcriptional regulator
LETKSFDEISVQDITDTATVNRATFYDHYTDKFALLEAMVAGGFHRLLDERKISSYDGTCPGAAQAIVLAVCDYLTQCDAASRAIYQHQGAFEPLIDAAVVHAIRQILMKGMERTPRTGSLHPDVVATSASWAIYGAAKAWSAIPDRPPAEEIAPMVLQLVMPMLQATRQLQKEFTVSPAAV